MSAVLVLLYEVCQPISPQVLSCRRGNNVSDKIEADLYVGRVIEFNGRSVVTVTRDGRTIHVPNSFLFKHPLVNHSEASRRRSSIAIRCSAHSDNLAGISPLILDAVRQIPGVMPNPPTSLLVQSLEPERITMLLRF